MYVCVYVCVRVHVLMHVCMYVCACVHMQNMHVCMSLSMCLHGDHGAGSIVAHWGRSQAWYTSKSIQTHVLTFVYLCREGHKGEL